MDQFRQIGEVVGSLQALMVLKHDIPINQKQCRLLFDMIMMAFEVISEEIRQHLRLDERNPKWKTLENPLKELYKVCREVELYIRHCMDIKDWWGRAFSLHLNRDCIEFHVHNLLCCFPVVIEALETAAEISGADHDDMQRRRVAIMKKYDADLNDPKLFKWKFGKQYLIPREISNRLESVWKEDNWLLLEKLREKSNAAKLISAKHEQKLVELMLDKLNSLEAGNIKLFPSSILVASHDYYVKRRLGSGGGYLKEIHWLGESFALRTFFGDIDPVIPQASLILSLSHPNILQHHCAFYDEEKKEGFLVMELMNKDLGTYIRENSGQRKRVPFSVPEAVDIMLQIARAMEYLHSKKIYHGELNPSNILLKARNFSQENRFLAKITGFGLTAIKNSHHQDSHHNQKSTDPVLWFAPEVLAQQERPASKGTCKYTEKADVYSFGMLCFQLLTGKIPFEDGHLQGEKVGQNIRAGERPLFPHPSPRYLANLTRKCWQTDPDLRPTFTSICRILRYVKKNLVINPDHGHPDSPPPLVDYCDLEAGFSKSFPDEGIHELAPVWHIPFQMFAYRLVEKQKISGTLKGWDSAHEGPFFHQHMSPGPGVDEHLAAMDELFLDPSDRRSVFSEIIERKDSSKAVDLRSVISEIPHRKLFSRDQRSVNSESPGGKSQLRFMVDQRSTDHSADTSERKLSQELTADHFSSHEAPAKKILLPASISSKSKSSEAVKSNLKKVEISGTPEKEWTLTTASDRRELSSETTEKKTPTNEPWRRLHRIHEKKLESAAAKNKKPMSPEATVTKKKAETKTATQKKNQPKDRERQEVPASKKATKGVTTTSSPGEVQVGSPRSSSARVTRSSATKTLYKTGTSPRSPMHVPKEYISPRASPLNPCARCTRITGDSPLSSYITPTRQRRGRVAESGIA